MSTSRPLTPIILLWASRRTVPRTQRGHGRPLRAVSGLLDSARHFPASQASSAHGAVSFPQRPLLPDPSISVWWICSPPHGLIKPVMCLSQGPRQTIPSSFPCYVALEGHYLSQALVSVVFLQLPLSFLVPSWASSFGSCTLRLQGLVVSEAEPLTVAGSITNFWKLVPPFLSSTIYKELLLGSNRMHICPIRPYGLRMRAAMVRV